MIHPQIEFICLRAAIPANQATTLDLLVKIIPPAVEVDLKRPPLNLGLVIDHSGSMSGRKIEYARQAARYAVEQLLPSDRVSVTIFDDQVESLVSSRHVSDKAAIFAKIQQIQAGGSTALHAGWLEGGVQVSQHFNAEHLNRVILLSDGLANVGETNPDGIANDVHGLSQRGVNTTTMGVGDDYDENLMEAMARSGDGNFYHIESPQQLPDIFQSELLGLMATLGQKVSLGIELLGQVKVVDVLNDLDKNSYGRYKLPNLVVGCPIAILVRLSIPAQSKVTDLCTFRLAWDDPQQEQRQVIKVTLRLPVVSIARLEEFPLNPEVQQQVALLMTARARQEAVQQMDVGNYAAAKSCLQNARSQVLACAPSPIMEKEAELLRLLEADLDLGDVKKSRKKAVFESYNLRRSRPDK